MFKLLKMLKNCRNSSNKQEFSKETREIRTDTRKQVGTGIGIGAQIQGKLAKIYTRKQVGTGIGIEARKCDKFKEIWQKSVPGSKYYCLKHCRNSSMLFLWVCRNRNPA